MQQSLRNLGLGSPRQLLLDMTKQELAVGSVPERTILPGPKIALDPSATALPRSLPARLKPAFLNLIATIRLLPKLTGLLLTSVVKWPKLDRFVTRTELLLILKQCKTARLELVLTPLLPNARPTNLIPPILPLLEAPQENAAEPIPPTPEASMARKLNKELTVSNVIAEITVITKKACVPLPT